MKRKNFQLLVMLFSLLSLTILGISCTGAQTNQAVSQKQPATKQAKFDISPITVKPKWLFSGDDTTVSVTVKNAGDDAGPYEATLLIDGQKSAVQNIALLPGESGAVSFSVAGTSSSTKSVAIGESKTSLFYSAAFPYQIQYDHYGEVHIGKGGEQKVLGGWGDIRYDPYGQMVKFTVPAKPFRITSVSLMCRASMLTELDKQRHFTINIWNHNRKQIWTSAFPWTLFSGIEKLVTLEVPNISVDDDFYVEFVSHSPYKQSVEGSWKEQGEDVFLALIFDISDYISRSSGSNQGKPMTPKPFIGQYDEYIIRVGGEGGSIKVIYYDDATEDIYKATSGFSFTNAFVATSYPFDLRLIQLYGYRDIKDAGDRYITLKVIDKANMQSLWQKNISWSEIPYSGIKLGSWSDIDTGGVICNHDFYIELTTNDYSDAHIWLGCDTSSINRNSDMSDGSSIISWREWLDTSGADIKKYTRDNTKWMIRVGGIPK